MNEPVIEEEPLFCPPLAMYFLETSKELAFCHRIFTTGKNIYVDPASPMIKSYATYSFDMFIIVLKIYLSLRGGAVAIESDLHEVNHKTDIFLG